MGSSGNEMLLVFIIKLIKVKCSCEHVANIKNQHSVTKHLCPASVRFLSQQFYSKVIMLSIFHRARTLGQRQ